MPTLALVNSVLFQSVRDPQKDAPAIRTLGTLGWIASGIVVGSAFLLADKTLTFPGARLPRWPSITRRSHRSGEHQHASLTRSRQPLFFSDLFCFILPNTPPQLKGQKMSIGDMLGLKALSLMKDRSFAVFIICSLLICIPLSFYYQTANGYLKAMGVENSEGVMTLGQVSEIGFLLLVPFFFKRDRS